MDSAQAVNILNTNRLNSQRDLLHKVISKLEQCNVQGASEALDLIPQTLKNVQDQAYDNLMEAWLSYKEPIFTLSEWICLVQKNAADSHGRSRAREKARLTAAYTAAVENPQPEIRCVGNDRNHVYNQFLLERDLTTHAIPPSLGMEMPEFQADQHVIRDERTCYALCPNSLERLERPLKYAYTPSLADFQQEIIFFPMTKVLNLIETLQNCMKRGQALGYDRNQFIMVLKTFIDIHAKEFAATIRPLTGTHACFKAVLTLVHTYDILPTINSQLRKLTRYPKESIHQFFLKHTSLLNVKIKYSQPHLTATQVENKAEAIAKTALVNFVEDNTKENYLQFIKVQNSIGEPVSLIDSLNFIRDLESSSPHFALQENKSGNYEIETNIYTNTINSYVATTRSVTNPNIPRVVYNTPRFKRKSSLSNGSVYNKSRFQTRVSRAPKRNVSFGNTPKYRSQSRDGSTSSRNTSKERSMAPLSSPQQKTYKSNNQRFSNNKPFHQKQTQNTNFRDNYSQPNGNNKPYQNKDSGYRERKSYQTNIKYQNRQPPKYNGQQNFSKNNDKKHFYDKERNRNRSATPTRQTTGCLRCLDKNHVTENCPTYWVTTTSPCTCGGFHYRHACQNRNN